MNENLRVQQYCIDVAANFDALQHQAGYINAAAGCIANAIESGHKLMICGNGGSAADAQHIAAEFIGHFWEERRALPAIALTTDSSILTSVSNDLGFDSVFARQVQGLGCTGDVLLAISTSGNSANIIHAVEAAKSSGMKTIGLGGEGGGSLTTLCDISICVPSNMTNHIQEMHIAVGHMICAIVEKAVR